MKLTVDPAIVHTALATASMVKVTVNPELAVAVTVWVAPVTLALGGAVEVKVMVWSCLSTENVCCACGAAFQSTFPAWLALSTQVPPPMNETVEPTIEQTDAAEASTVKVTPRPEVAVALTV